MKSQLEKRERAFKIAKSLTLTEQAVQRNKEISKQTSKQFVKLNIVTAGGKCSVLKNKYTVQLMLFKNIL